MKSKENKISIEEFLGKKYKIKFYEPAENKLAIITHYLQNNEKKYSDCFKEDAQKYIYELAKAKSDIENEVLITAEEAEQYLLFEVNDVPFPAPEKPKFTFIDLFAGIGGFRIAMQNLGGKCVFSSEWDENAKKTYKANFGEVPFGDITKEETKKYIPDNFDILCAGFPCQAFSIAGRRGGFEDTRGTLFFDVAEIIKRKRPKAVFLENVKNLQAHDNGRTFKIMLDVLENQLNYKVFYKVLNSMTHANIPQNRERIFIVAIDAEQVPNADIFEFPSPIQLTSTIHDLILLEKQEEKFYYKKDHIYYKALNENVNKSDTVYQWRRVYVRENKNNVCPTLTANMGTGGHNIPIIRDDFGIRKLIPKECFLFQGYPAGFILPPIANSKLYMQAGNSVTVPLIQRVGQEIVKIGFQN